MHEMLGAQYLAYTQRYTHRLLVVSYYFLRGPDLSNVLLLIWSKVICICFYLYPHNLHVSSLRAMRTWGQTYRQILSVYLSSFTECSSSTFVLGTANCRGYSEGLLSAFKKFSLEKKFKSNVYIRFLLFKILFKMSKDCQI